MTIAGLGGTSEVERLRGGAREVVAVAMYAAPDEPKAALVELGERSVLPGLKVAGVNPRVITDMQLPLSAKGVVVVDPGPYGARAGLQRGDLLLGINREEVTSPGEVADVLAETGRWLSIDLLRRGQRVSLRMRL